jgi:hypothetical protein
MGREREGVLNQQEACDQSKGERERKKKKGQSKKVHVHVVIK